MNRWRTTTPCLAALLVLAGALSSSQDRATVVPDMKVLLQNNRVRVPYHDVAVGETTPIHSYPAYVAYVFTDYTGKAILSDGREIALARKAGDVSITRQLLTNRKHRKNGNPQPDR